MTTNGKSVFACVALIGTATACLYASDKVSPSAPDAPGNSYYFFTGGLKVDNDGVVQLPKEFTWSVETSWRGIDLNDNNLPDTRVMLRLHNPTNRRSALTAQMDLATASQLHRELGDIIARKLQNPDYQDRPHTSRQERNWPTKSNRAGTQAEQSH